MFVEIVGPCAWIARVLVVGKKWKGGEGWEGLRDAGVAVEVACAEDHDVNVVHGEVRG